MIASEVKLRLSNKLNSLIDIYFNGNNITEKFLNSTLKIILKQNMSKLDDIFELFSDKNGEIDLLMMANEYSNMIPEEGIVFDLRDYISNDMIKNIIPDKVLLIKRDDIMSIVS